MPQAFKVYDGHYPHFVTCAIVHWIPVFRREDYFAVLADSFRYCIEHRGLLLHGYVIMPDLFHAICSQTEGRLSLAIGQIKGYTSHQIAEMVRVDGRADWVRAMHPNASATANVWQDGFHPEEVHSRLFFEQKLRYIHENPVRAGFVEDPCAWKYSSAGIYYKDEASIIPVAGIEW